MAGMRRVRRVCHAIQPHAPTTETTARMVIHTCILTNIANKEPVPVTTAAGSANGKTQHTPQATAPVESVTAVTPAAFEPGGSFWRSQAERLVSAYVWSEGKAPDDGRLIVRDVSRDDLDVAARWDAD